MMQRLGVRTVLVAIGCMAFAGALLVGISDNPPVWRFSTALPSA